MSPHFNSVNGQGLGWIAFEAQNVEPTKDLVFGLALEDVGKNKQREFIFYLEPFLEVEDLGSEYFLPVISEAVLRTSALPL